MADLFKKKKKTVQTQDSSTTSNLNTTGTTAGTSAGAFDKTSTALAPDWIKQPTQDLLGTITGLGKQDPLEFVAGSNPLIDQAGKGASNLTGTPWNYDAALDLTKGVATANAPQSNFVGAAGFIDDFQNPYKRDVIDATLADFDFDRGQTRAQQDLDLTLSGAFGGSGSSLTKSMTEDNLARARNSISSSLNKEGFDTSLSAAIAEATRKQGVNDLNAGLRGQHMDRTLGGAGQIADLAGAYGAEQRANIGAQANMGGVQRDIEAERRAAPLTQADAVTQLMQQLGLDKYFGQQDTGATSGTTSGTNTGTSTGATTGNIKGVTKQTDTPSIAQMAGQGIDIAMALAMMSDANLKRDVVTVGFDDKGRRWVNFNYHDDPEGAPRRFGVIAQEVRETDPDAVHVHPSGYLMVDYAPLLGV